MTELKMVYELVISRVNLLDKGYQHNQKNIYREETLQELCLGLHSMCIGTESKYFNGHTNIIDDTFLCFGVKGLMDTNRRLKDAMLFNVLSYMTNELLGKGNTVAAIDELYLFLTNMTAIFLSSSLNLFNACLSSSRSTSTVLLYENAFA